MLGLHFVLGVRNVQGTVVGVRGLKPTIRWWVARAEAHGPVTVRLRSGYGPVTVRLRSGYGPVTVGVGGRN